MATGAPATPPVAPRSTSANSFGDESTLRERAAGGLPGAAGQVTDRGPTLRVTDDDELPRLPVLRTRRVRRGFEHPRDVGVGHGRVAEVAMRALTGDDREDVVGRGAHSDAPTRLNVFTYMIRSCGWNAQRFHSAVPAAPMRCSTSGVIAL